MTKHSHIPSECEVVSYQVQVTCRASVEDVVTWWTYLVRLMCVEVTNDSALPVVVISAWAIASVHTLPNSHDTIALRTANSIRSPTSITTSVSSPMVSGYLYCISLAKPYMGWSNAITAVCPWLRCSTAFIATVMPCLIMAIEWAASARRGSNDIIVGFRVSVVLHHDTIAVVFLGAFPFPACLATVDCISSLSLSLSLCWWSSTFCFIWLSHLVSFIVVSDSASSSPFTLHCILSTLKPPCLIFDMTKGVNICSWVAVDL